MNECRQVDDSKGKRKIQKKMNVEKMKRGKSIFDQFVEAKKDPQFIQIRKGAMVKRGRK